MWWIFVLFGVVILLIFLMHKKGTWQATVDTQVKMYKLLKAQMPFASEQEILSQLVESRLNAFPASPLAERAFLYGLLEDPDTNIFIIILGIVLYEHFLSKNIIPDAIMEERIKRYILTKLSE